VGIKMIVEILDHWQDWDLTAGERDDLIVIAEQARDETRATFAPLHQPFILKRAGKSAASWRNAISKLMKKKVLEHAVENGRKVTGHEGQTARYRIARLCPHGKHDGRDGQCKRDESVTPEMTHSKPEGHSTDDTLSPEGHSTDARGSSERCEEGHLRGDTYPSSSPQDPSSLSVPVRLVRAAAVVAEEDEENFIAWLKNEHKPKRNAWWRTVADNGDFADLAADWQAQRAQPTAPKPTGERCTACSTIAPVALTHRGKPYCAACTATCTSCHTAQPEDQLANGECHPCRTARSSAA
jgi:hypothetical protein